MQEDTLSRAAHGLRLLAAILVAGAGLRMLIFGALRASAEKPEARASAPEPKARVAAPPAAPAATRAAPAPSGPKPERGKLKPGASIRVSLVVMAKTSRSEVLVNGATIGHSPFIGEVSCKAGEPVRVQIVPASGSPRTYTRQCSPGALRIEE
jgi:hypothetical protein